jgi:hypothetical protein
MMMDDDAGAVVMMLQSPLGWYLALSNGGLVFRLVRSFYTVIGWQLFLKPLSSLRAKNL